MAAFNWIVVPATCPRCKQRVTLRAQTHVASSYGGDKDGRFHDREYQLGDEMAWHEKEAPGYPQWRAGRGPFGADVEQEACIAECPNCAATLYVIIRFREVGVDAVVGIGLEENWPPEYPR